DTGPVAYQSLFPIDDGETGFSLSSKCVREGLSLMRRFLDDAASDPGAIPSIPQDLSRREYFGREVPEGGRLCGRPPSRAVDAFVRVLCHYPSPPPWGHPTALRGPKKVGIVRASRPGEPAVAAPGTVTAVVGSDVRVACADECLTVHLLHAEGRY